MLFYLFVLFVTVVLIQVFYYLIIFGSFSFSKNATKKNTSTKKPPISLIICAKNEAENLTKHLPLFIEQNYPKFEIILINDASYDTTLDVMEAFAEKHPNIKVVNVKAIDTNTNWSSKKYALTLGIKAAKYDYLLLTDADCYPTSKEWINEIGSSFSTDKSIVLGYGSYADKAPTFLNKLIRFETLLTALQYFSWAKQGNPYMGVGRNLAYKKDHFFNANGFVEHMKIISGDDDLFINNVATGKNTSFTISPESFTQSLPKETFKEWYDQKRRHITTAKYYKFKDQFVLGLFYFSQLAFLLIAIVLLSLNYFLYIVLAIIAMRYIVCYLTVGFTAKKLQEKGLILWYPVLELALVFTQVALFITNIFTKKNHWR